jgi:hypothetical protein
VLFMIRDPRAVLNSWLELDREWTDRYPDSIVRNWGRSALELERWRGHPHVQVVRYEDLVMTPEDTLTTVFSFLDLDFDRSILDRHASIEQVDYPAQARVDATRIDHWRATLSPSHLRATEHLVGAEMLRLGYTPDEIIGYGQELAGLGRRLKFCGKTAVKRLLAMDPRRVGV